MATVGVIQVLLTAKTAMLAKQLNDSASQIKGFAGQLGGVFGNVGSGFGGITSSLAGITGAAGPAGVALLAVAGAAAAALAAGYGLWKLSEPVIEAADNAFKLATALHMPTEALMGLQAMAKKEANILPDDFATALDKFAKKLGEAASQAGPARDAVEALGLDAGKLSTMSLDKAFIAVGGAIHDLNNPLAQAMASTDLLGKAGQKLMPMFADGAQGITDAIAKAQDMGVAMTDFDAAKLAAAKDVIEEIGQRFEGIKNKLVIELAPVIQAVAEQVLALIPSASTMKDFFINAIDVVVTAVGVLGDAWRVVKIGVELACLGALTLLAGLATGVEGIATGIVWIINKLGGKATVPEWISSMGEETRGMVVGMAEDIQSQLNEPWPHEQAQAWMNDVRKRSDELAQHMVDKKNSIVQPITDAFLEARKKIKQIIDDLQKDLDTFGMSSGEKKLFDLQALGATTKDLEKAQGLVDNINAKELLAGAESPMDKALKTYQQIQGLAKKGIINPEQTQRLLANLAKGLQDTTSQALTADIRRSKDEFKVPAEQKRDVLAELKDLDEKMLAEAVKQTKALETIATAKTDDIELRP